MIDSIIDEAEERDTKHYASLNQVQDNILLVTKTPWLRRTGWEETFKGKDMLELSKLTNALEQRAYDERNLWESVSRVIHQCFKG